MIPKFFFAKMQYAKVKKNHAKKFISENVAEKCSFAFYYCMQ
jgi:hypothetical protein